MEVDSGSATGRRYRPRRRRLAPVLAQLAAPIVLGLLVGGVLAYQAGSTNNAVQPVPLGAVPTPTPAWVKPAPATGAVLPPGPGRLAPSAGTPSALPKSAPAQARAPQ
ncbi:MAG TPA: hypothetical protein VH478_18340 [Trebonia sp.]|nr:hypothetical protein [Trebonia sp.]